MILGVDIGGTKTLFGVFNSSGKLLYSARIETPKKYSDFLISFKSIYESLDYSIEKIVVAAPGRINTKNNQVIRFGNLPWKNIALQADVSKITGISTSVENDAKLAALAEYEQLTEKVVKFLYITFSTGIGAGLVYKGRLSEALLDSEVGHMLLPNPDKNNELERWETFASGKALYEKYGKKAEELSDTKAWQQYTRKMALGIVDLCAVLEPEVVIIGGGVGSHFNKYGIYLNKFVRDLTPPMVIKPKIFGAKNAELAALIGCYEYSKLGSVK